MPPTLRLAAMALVAVALSACQRLDPVGTDLVALNTASQAAMAQADVQSAMAKVQAAASDPEKAAIMRGAAAAIARGQATLQKTEMASPEVRALQQRMVAGFGKLGDGARTAATSFEQAVPADLDRARRQMRDGQVEFLAAGQEMVQLARRRSVDLNAPKKS